MSKAIWHIDVTRIAKNSFALMVLIPANVTMERFNLIVQDSYIFLLGTPGFTTQEVVTARGKGYDVDFTSSPVHIDIIA